MRKVNREKGYSCESDHPYWRLHWLWYYQKSVWFLLFCAVESLAIFHLRRVHSAAASTRWTSRCENRWISHQLDIAFPSTRDVSSAKQLRFVSALHRRQVVKRKEKTTIFHELSQTPLWSTYRTEVRMSTAISHDPQSRWRKRNRLHFP